MTSAFTETLHPRGQAGNAGQFRTKSNNAPTGALIAPSDEYAAAGENFAAAQDTLRREAAREMARVAPAGAATVVFELYSEGDPELELLAFQGLVDRDGEDIAITPELNAYYWDLGSRIDHETAEEYGFVRDSEMFNLEIPDNDPDSTGAHLNDEITLLQFVTFNAARDKRDEAEQRVHTAAAAHIRALAGSLKRSVDTVVLEKSEGVGLILVRTEGADGTSVHDYMTYRHPAYAADRNTLDSIAAAASNIRQPSLARLSRTGGNEAAPYRLKLNP